MLKSFKLSGFYQVFFALDLKDMFCLIIANAPFEFGCNSLFTPIYVDNDLWGIATVTMQVETLNINEGGVMHLCVRVRVELRVSLNFHMEPRLKTK